MSPNKQDDKNKGQTNLAKDGIAGLYSPGGSSNLQLHVLAAGFDPKSPFPSGPARPVTTSNTICHCIPQVYLPNGILIHRRTGQGETSKIRADGMGNPGIQGTEFF